MARLPLPGAQTASGDSDEQSNPAAGPDEGTEAQSGSMDEGQQPPQVQLRRRSLPKVGPGNEPAAEVGPEDALEDPDEQMVNMIFPREMVLTDDKHRRVRFPLGLVSVPAHLADHWYLKANGVRRQGAPKKPVED